MPKNIRLEYMATLRAIARTKKQTFTITNATIIEVLEARIKEIKARYI